MEIKSEVILDSLIEKTRVTCLRVTYPRIVHAEFMRHRCGSYCVSGDTNLYFQLPATKNLYKYNLKDFHDKWHYGVVNESDSKRQTYAQLSKQLDPVKLYTVKELKSLGFKYIQNCYNVGDLKSTGKGTTKRILGSDLIAWVNSTSSYRQPVRDRLKNMQLRCFDQTSQEFTTTQVKDIWISGQKDVYRVTTEDGKSIKITDDHPLLFQELGWGNIKDLLKVHRSGSIAIWEPSEARIAVNGEGLLYKNSDWLQAQKNQGKTLTTIADELGLRRWTLEPWAKKFGLVFSKKLYLKDENLRYKDATYLQKMKDCGYSAGLIAKENNTTEDRVKKEIKKHKIKTSSKITKTLRPTPWNKGIKYRQTEKAKASVKKFAKLRNEKIRESRFFSTDKLRDRADFLNLIRRSKFEAAEYSCAVTGLKGKLNLHHIDPCWHNPARIFDESNIIVLNAKFHRLLHARNLELEFMDWIYGGNDPKAYLEVMSNKIPATDINKVFEKKVQDRKTVKWQSIVDIEYIGVETVYDLEVMHIDHNFVADGIVVHNCSASSRAIPLDRMISQFGGFMPDKWRLHQSGMQPNEAHEFSKEQLDEIEILYEELRLKSINTATRLHQIGVSKEQVNRLIEPYSYITHLVQMTSAGFKSFFDLRLPTTAQYEIRKVAEAMWASLEDSVPEERKCHIPFYNGDYTNLEVSMKASSARCARTSFYNHEGKEPSLEEDLSLATRLLNDRHMSPFEFPVLSFGMANAMFGDIIELDEYYFAPNYSVLKPKNLSGNLGSPDLVQYRKLLEQPRIE